MQSIELTRRPEPEDGAAPSAFARLSTLAVVVFVGLWLQACATAPSGVLVPTTAVPQGADTVSVLVYSTRATTDEPGVIYSGKRGERVTSMTVDVSIPPDHEIGAIEWPRHRQADPSRDFATVSAEAIPDDAAAAAWISSRQTNGHLLVFVHGFNVPFDRAVYSLAQLTHDSGVEAAPVLFTWPSLGRVWGYVYDRESANYSRDALEQLLRTAARNPDVTEITVMAHSMGSWIAVEALRQYAIRDGRVDPKIQNVILAAPDLDVDVFAQQFFALGEERPHFTFLVSRDDRALRVSRLIAGGVQRVGAMDPSVGSVRSILEQIGGVTVVNLTNVHGRDRLNHSVFAESPEVVRLLGGSLMSGAGASRTSVLSLGSIVLDVAETITSDFSQKPPATGRTSNRSGGAASAPPPAAQPTEPERAVPDPVITGTPTPEGPSASAANTPSTEKGDVPYG
ncbi:alpha/beta hydrolase [uncultured Brevundimonas sp.]|mgnify:CR=1 FL=1|uniref:alpha/beta hydrolase n=1 Tax=uncultured Brevundimonas sp. TaxID=213418 RepID=UPI0025E899F5|nr:alpha/beta hydrolase [uncultured Brevundimonas sp.]